MSCTSASAASSSSSSSSSSSASTLTCETRPLSSGSNGEEIKLFSKGRRYSYDTFRPRLSSVCHADAVFARVDLFLTEMKRRLDRLEQYRKESLTQVDAQLERGYNALKDVRDSCSAYTSSEVLWGAAQHRAHILVETLETKYNDFMPSRETLEQKAQEGMRVMEAYLNELETRTQSSKKHLLESTYRRLDDSITFSKDLLDETCDKARHATEVLADSIAYALARANDSRLIYYHELPVPWRGNAYILKGYRFCETPWACWASIFTISNETVNIWSHVVGAVIVLSLAFYFYPQTSTFPLSSIWDVLIAAAFFIAACKCLVCSIMWHTMNSISSPRLLSRFACVDYTGIAFLVAASILTTEWTAFYCEPVSRAIYMSLTVVLGVLGSILPWRESFNRHDMAWFRVAFYVTLACTGFAPVVQLNYTRGWEWTYYFYAPIGKSVFVYFLGAIIYASQVPEKWLPGAFDYCGASHNIWHVAVVVAIVFHYHAMMEFFQGAFQRAVSEESCQIDSRALAWLF